MNVTVIGGSIAGLNTALYLLSSSAEFNVTVLERKKAIGDNIVCAGGIASYMIKKLKLEIPEEFVAAEIKKVRFYSPSLEYAEIEMKKEYGYVLWRDKWERWLGERVEELDGKIYLKSYSPNKIIQNSDVIVGADGLLGVSRRLTEKNSPSREDIHVAIQAVGLTKKCEDDTISLFFGHQLAPKGYAWAFPLGNGKFRIGLGIPLSKIENLIPCFRRLCSTLDVQIVERAKAKLLPTAPPEKSLVKNNIALVGDAGLQTDPATGGGIANAIVGAKSLARALERGKLKLYDKFWKSELYGRNKRRYGLKQILYEMSDGEFEMLIDLLKDFKPFSESIGKALIHLLIELAFKSPRFFTKHKILRRLLIG